MKDGEYTIQSELGEGTFGTTYKATPQLPDAQQYSVAIKIGREELTENEQSKIKQDFQYEANRLKQFNHKHIVKFIEYFYDQTINRPCIVMEYIQGKTLEQLIKEGDGIPEEQAIEYIKQVADALAAIHDENLIHRDVTPSKIIVRDGTKEAVLIGFSIAREFIPNRTLEVTQTLLTDDHYAPPEQELRRARLGPPFDIYSLSATLYFLLTGRQPVSSRDRENELKTYKRDPQKQNVQKFVTNQKLRRAILQGMELEPNRRPQSISEWLKLLDSPGILSLTYRLRRLSSLFGVRFLWILIFFGSILSTIAINYAILPTNQSPPNKPEFAEIETKFFSAIYKLEENQDVDNFKEVLNLFEQNKNNYQGNKEFEELFSELTRRYAQDVLALSGEPGVRKGIEKLEEIQKRLDQNFEIEKLPEDDIIAQEYKDVSALLEKMRNSRNGNN
ncbi:serine/threonine-protein kinase [Moorena sp. SIO3I6]|uniref:serine/threonine protein kinase n=1 Tax=Moorena sp. SIO3I6 TaxID=2607831 RepID=UPI0013F78BE9|nr:serine/threonine-protein kinase [Moorena sp. SIO3I6]NEP28445.1 serine/threonine protein kinase [Moorena sp. SIO3I6]